MWWIQFFFGYLSIRRSLFQTISCNPFQNQRKIEKVVFFKKKLPFCVFIKHRWTPFPGQWTLCFIIYLSSGLCVEEGNCLVTLSSYLRGLLSVGNSDSGLFPWYTKRDAIFSRQTLQPRSMNFVFYYIAKQYILKSWIKLYVNL